MNIEYKQYLLSNEWLSIRLDILTSRKVCERCGSKKRLQVHHKHYRNIFNEEPEDLELLCDRCHKKEHKPKISLAKKVKKLKQKRNGKQNNRRKKKRFYSRMH